MSISRLSAGFDVTRQAVTKHLQVMKEAGLARSIRQGRESVWHLEPNRLEEARGYLAKISGHWDDALERLRQLVEEGSSSGSP